jgi:hypothetical protein
MQKIEDYRLHGEECRVLASRARGETERQMLLNMAQTWESLADARVEQIKRAERLKVVET